MEALLYALMTLVGTIVVAYLAQRWTLGIQIRLNDRQKRQQVYSELVGRKFVTTQLYVSRFEASIYSDYHEARWRVTGYRNDSLDGQESQWWMHKGEDVALEIAKNNQNLFETIGSVFTVFADSPELKGLVDRLYHFRALQIVGRPGATDLAQVEAWKAKAVKQLQSLAEAEYTKPIDHLLAYLASEIAKDKK